MNRRAMLFWGGLVAVLLVLGLATGGRTQSGSPLDPDSTDPLGTRALILFLEQYGAGVIEELPDGDTPRALMLADQLSPDQRTELGEWVEDGGTLIVTDPGSPLVPDGFGDVDDSGVITSGVCSVEELAGLRLEAASFVLYPTTGNDQADRSCFGDGAVAYVHVIDRGQGRIVALGGGLPLTNQNLDEADNAVLAARLLLGDTQGGAIEGGPIAVLYDPLATAGTRTFGDLIPSAAKWATWQLLVAFAIYVLWRGPRFGRPVEEPQPVELPGSLLVRATGELHRRSGGHHEAGHRLRRHLDRRLRTQLRASPELPPEELVRTAAVGHDIDEPTIGRALLGPPAATGQDLADLLADIDQVDAAILTEPDAVSTPEPPIGAESDRADS